VPELPTRTPSAREPALKIYDNLLGVLGVVGTAVSGWSIATLLHEEGGMPWYLAGLGVGVYDLLAFMAGLMVYIRRHEPHRAVGAQVLMLAAVAGSAYVNYMHGRQIGGDLVALLLGAAPVVFEVAFAMRHNVLTLVTATLFPRAMWSRYKDGVWVKLHTGSLPAASGDLPAELPEPSGGSLVWPSGEVTLLPEAPGMSPEGVARKAAALADELEAGHRETISEAVRRLTPATFSEASGGMPEDPEVAMEWAKARSETIRKIGGSAISEDSPEAAGRLPESPAERAEAVAEALRKGERITGETVAALYGVSDRTGRDYIRRAKAINAARSEGSER